MTWADARKHTCTQMKQEEARNKHKEQHGQPVDKSPGSETGTPSKRVRYSSQLQGDAQQSQQQQHQRGSNASVEKRIASLFGEDEESDGEHGSSDDGDGEGATGQGVAAAQGPNRALAAMLKPKRTPAHVAAAAAGNKRHKRGGAVAGPGLPRGGAAGRGRGGDGGRKQPAFNPYDIPDEHLIKGGKRSTVMPRSGNRTVTYK